MTTTPFLDPIAARDHDAMTLNQMVRMAAALLIPTHLTEQEAVEEFGYALRDELAEHQLLTGESSRDGALRTARLLRLLATELTEQMHTVAARARVEGATWAEVGKATGVSLQRAQQRYKGL